MEWMWCETWCGNETKAQARTIDLCNNPLTKEPKLQNARRIVKEWPALDEEVGQLTERVTALLAQGYQGDELLEVLRSGSSEPKAAVVLEESVTREHERKKGHDITEL
eukprot:TRINITY_DN22194_c0_g1_i1.p5 TRINITY_DN22194_c0_g1~~TRINITY_DN22194_c0_g1_i1.p5  ORF type:complete len:108 (-),score=12.99 TRINITY_DN22194_c0_g1_i1:369-692(-)